MRQMLTLPEPLTGNELVTVLQAHNGEWSACGMCLSDLLSCVAATSPALLIASMPTSLPSQPGVLWNNAGVISVS